MPQRRTETPVVSVINMKGGVGKTLISANVFGELFRVKRKRVLLIDFDPQFNLSQLLLRRAEYDQLKEQGKTLLSVLEPPAPTTVFHVSGDDLLDVGEVDGYTHLLKSVTGPSDIELRLLPGDFDLARLNLREREPSLRIPRHRFARYVDGARKLYDLVVLDCNPSTSFLTRSALEVSTDLLIPIRPDRYSILGAEMLFSFMDYLPTLAAPRRRMLVLNGLQDPPKRPEQESIAELRADRTFGPLTLVADVPYSDVLKSRPDYAGFAVDRRVPWTRDIKHRLAGVANEIAGKLEL